MAKRIIFLLLLSAAATIVCNSCKKYPEDDDRYYSTPCGRIARKWLLVGITDRLGRDYQDSVFHFKATSSLSDPEETYTYEGLILEMERSDNALCLETGITGKATVLNKPFSSGSYELRFKRSMLKLDLRPSEHSPKRYFIGDYTIFKMTRTELIFGQGEARAFFKAIS